MKALKRIDITYQLNKLPKVTNKGFIFKGEKGCSGSIFRRRMKGLPMYWHYAFVYGFDKNGRLLLIENNEDGVECITWEDFYLGMKCELYYVEPNLKRFAEIMRRAKEKIKHKYLPSEHNCEHFVNYCVHGKEESIQVDNTKKVADAFFSYLEIRLLNTPNSHMALEAMNGFRESMKVPRNIPNMGSKLDKKIKETISNAKKK